MIWHKAEPGSMPEDIFKKKSFSKRRVSGKLMTATPRVLVVDGYCGAPGVTRRVKLEGGGWYWSDGALFGHVIAWTEIENFLSECEAIADKRERQCREIWNKKR